ncbi:MAG: serine hydrolase [Ruminococcus sp.]|nr:serine hydrolase [Ruminococcus sp.]
MKKNIKSVICILQICIIMIFCIPSGAYAIDPISQMNNLVNNYPRECSVLLCAEDGRTLYTYHAKNLMYGASVIKLSYAVYACKQISQGVHSLDETMTYTSDWNYGGSGIIKNQPYGTKYTIRQLLEYTLKYSDNIAYFMLVNLFGKDGFNEMISEWGYDISITKESSFTDVNADFMRTSMMKMHSYKDDGECWEVCWKALLESDTALIRDAVGGDVALKYGIYDVVYHEVSYVESETPYILVVMTKIPSATPDKTFVKNVAVCADDIAEQYYANNDYIGDIDRNGIIDAIDSTSILVEYVALSTGGESVLTEEQRKNADVNGDGLRDAVDATLVLNYYAYVSAGGEVGFRDFLDS